ncbi:acyltransferase family protein [Rhizobium sp. YTU87027]|uniref:acyltransferase family protein n=1 Tax=Rhizobium sp. YTU87027 TaxID=3417741 RepID=UPI003D695FDF
MNVPTLAALFGGRQNNLNLMRLLAALAVIYGHTSAVTGKAPPDLFLQLVGFKFLGGVAVDVFFVLSGFLITASALKSTMTQFVLSRVLRIYPALVVCMVVTVFVIGGIFTTDNSYYSNGSTWRYFLTNATGTGTEYYLPGVFDNLHDKAVNGSIWSIVLELRLYASVFVLMYVGVLLRKNAFNVLCVFLICAGYFGAGFIDALIPDANHRHVALMFLLGSFACINRLEFPLSPLLLLFLLFLSAATHGTDKFIYMYTITLTYLVFYVALIPGARWFDNVGDYSYGVYLYGWPSQQLVATAFPSLPNSAHTLLACSLALFFAAFSWHFIEKPCLSLKKRLRLKRSHSDRISGELSRNETI